MREIKFRAWNGEKYSEPFTFKDLIPTVWFEGDMDEDRVIEIPGLRESIDDDSLIFEQYTGLKDKNGLSNIYEGDIIDGGGAVYANIHQGKERRSTDLVVEGMGTSKWRDTESEAIRRGCQYAE